MGHFKCQLCGIDVDGYVADGDKYMSNNSKRLKNGIYCYGTCEEYALRKLEKQFNSNSILNQIYIIIFLFVLFIIKEFNITINYDIPEYYNKYIDYFINLKN
jgi:hypothetical protein